MNTIPIPVRMVGAGSHAEEEELQYLDFPRDMRTFEMPRVPERADVQALARSRAALAGFLAQLEDWRPGDGPNPCMDLQGIDPAALAITNQMLGDGEVSIQVGGRRPLRIQESVFTGLWRIVELDGDGRLRADWLEAASLPEVVLDAARNGSATALHPVEIPPGTMNAPALLHELSAQVKHRRPGAAPHVMNLTLFPLTVEDHRVLERALPVGDVAIISRGFGNCRITSTATRDVWRVQYFNSMNTLILNTIEVVDVPEVALAADEDLVDSRERLAELIAWMGESGEA
jgi:hydrogenase-1 operon protein HyaF